MYIIHKVTWVTPPYLPTCPTNPNPNPNPNPHLNMSSFPLPTLPPTSTKALSHLLQQSVSTRKIPATFFGLTNAQEEFYFDCEGEKEFGSGGEGVGEDTSEYWWEKAGDM